jgi:hypothetical protein
MSVYFRCAACGGEHKSTIHVGCKDAFQECKLEKISVTCPITKKEMILDARAFFWKQG